MHGNGGSLSSQRLNGITQSLKNKGTSTQDRIDATSESDSDEQRSPLWTRPAHMRNGFESGSDTSSSLVRLTLTGDSRFSHSLLKLAAGGLLKLSVAEDCDLHHHFEIENCSGGKVLETPPIVPGSAFTWRPPGPGKYQLVDQVYPWIKSIVSVSSPTTCSSTLSEASESQASTPDGPLSVQNEKWGSANGVQKKALDEVMAPASKGPSANGVAPKRAEIVTQQIEVEGGPGSFGVVARTSFAVRAGEQEKEESYGGGNEVDDLLRVPLLAKKSNKRKELGEPQSNGQVWNESWEDSSADESPKSEAPLGLRRRAKEGDRTQAGTETQKEGAEASLQVRQIINPGEIDEWVERISREEEESRNAVPPSEVLAGGLPDAANEEAAEKEVKRGGKAHKKRKKKSSGKKEASAAEPENPEEDSKTGLLDDPMSGINSLLSSLPSTTGITHYDVSNAGMVKGRPAKLMAIGRSADGKMEVAPISPMMSPSSLMKGGLSNSKFSERSSVVDEDDPIPYHRFEDLIDLESGMGFMEGMEQTRLHEVKNFGGARLPAHLTGFGMRDGSGWPLGGPHMSSLVPELPCRLKSCPKKFVSSVSMLRHYLQRHKKQGGDLTSERPTLMAFWADLTKEEQSALLCIKDVYIMGINGEAVSSELVQKARFRKLHGIKGARHMELGERLLNIVFSPVELPPTSAVDFFNALEEASEFTFLRGRTDPAVQRVCVADPVRGLGDEAYLVGLLAFMLEDRLVNAWMKSKEEGAMRTHQALLEEEEQAKKKRQKAQQKKDRKKQKRASEQLKQAAQEGPAQEEEDSDAGSPRADNEEQLTLEQALRSAESEPQVLSTSEVTTAGGSDRIESAWSLEEAQKEWIESGSSGGEESTDNSQPSLVQESKAASSPTEAAQEEASVSGQAREAGHAKETEPMHSERGGGDETVLTESADEGLLSSPDAAPPHDLPPADVSKSPSDSVSQEALPPADVSKSSSESLNPEVLPPADVSQPSSDSINLKALPPADVSKSSSESVGLEERVVVVSPSKSAIAVPVSRMGSKPKSGEALRVPPLPTSAHSGERLVLVTRMGPRAREKGRQGSGELQKMTSGEVGSKTEPKAASGEAGRSNEPVGSKLVNQAPSGPEQTAAVRSEEGVHSPAEEKGKKDKQHAEVESKLSGEKEPGAVAEECNADVTISEFKPAENTDSEDRQAFSRLLQASVDDNKAGVADNTEAQQNKSDAGTYEEPGPAGKEFNGPAEKESTKQSRRARNKSRGKQREGTVKSEGTEKVNEGVAAREETDWTERATRDLKSLLMGSEGSTGKRTADAGVVSSVSIVTEASSLQAESKQEDESDDFARSRTAEVANKQEAENEDFAKSEVLGAHKSQGWAKIVAAAAQLEEEKRQRQLEAEEKKRRRKMTKDEPVEAWPELGLVAKKGAPADKKKQGKKGETEAPAGPPKDEASKQPAQEGYGEGNEAREPSVEGSHRKTEVENELNGRAVNDEGQVASALVNEVPVEKERKQGDGGMEPGEIMAFFGARWHAALSDPEAIYIKPSSATQKEDVGQVPAPKTEAIEPTGWGSSTGPSSTPTTSKSAWSVAPNRGNEGDQMPGAAKDKVAEGEEEGGWQEARSRKGSEGRGRRGGQNHKDAMQGNAGWARSRR